jgi:hypothetical protein
MSGRRAPTRRPAWFYDLMHVGISVTIGYRIRHGAGQERLAMLVEVGLPPIAP